MKKLLAALLGTALLMGAMAVNATPEQDRKELLELYKKKFPNIKFEDYVNGALNFNPDALAQYRSIMEFPPYDSQFDEGKKMWDTPFKNGKKYAECFPNGGKNMAGHYPYFDESLGKVVTYEMAINSCRKTNGEDELDYKGAPIGLLTAYSRSLSDGMKVSVKVEGPKAIEAFKKGKDLFYGRRGQLNFACATCHVQNVGNTLRTELLSPALGHAAHWPEFRAGESITTLQQRYTQCIRNVRGTPFQEGGDDYNNLEYFHTYLSNGLPMQTPVFRK